MGGMKGGENVRNFSTTCIPVSLSSASFQSIFTLVSYLNSVGYHVYLNGIIYKVSDSTPQLQIPGAEIHRKLWSV